jgi:hypothetical protein
MPHTTNRDAFLRCDATQPFFRLYTLLVALELALKDRSASFADSHDLDALAKRAAAAGWTSDLQAVLTTFEQSLSKLRCTLKTGTGGGINPKIYPGLRYLRLAKDGFIDGSDEAIVAQALSDAQTLVSELKKLGVIL